MSAEVSPASAARFGLLVDAVQRGNRALAAEMLLSIPEAEFAAVEARLARVGLSVLAVLGPGPG